MTGHVLAKNACLTEPLPMGLVSLRQWNCSGVNQIKQEIEGNRQIHSFFFYVFNKLLQEVFPWSYFVWPYRSICYTNICFFRAWHEAIAWKIMLHCTFLPIFSCLSYPYHIILTSVKLQLSDKVLAFRPCVRFVYLGIKPSG